MKSSPGTQPAVATAGNPSSLLSGGEQVSSSDSLRRRSSGGAKHGIIDARKKQQPEGASGKRRSSGERKRRTSASLLELKTTYEGPCGTRSEKWLHRSTLIVTNRTIEIEREGANFVLSMLTLGCWWAMFQVYECDEAGRHRRRRRRCRYRRCHRCRCCRCRRRRRRCRCCYSLCSVRSSAMQLSLLTPPYLLPRQQRSKSMSLTSCRPSS